MWLLGGWVSVTPTPSGGGAFNDARREGGDPVPGVPCLRHSVSPAVGEVEGVPAGRLIAELMTVELRQSGADWRWGRVREDPHPTFVRYGSWSDSRGLPPTGASSQAANRQLAGSHASMR